MTEYRGVSGDIAMLPPGELRPHPRNSRTHSDDQLRRVRNSIEQFGFNAPVLAVDGLIIAGHARVLAAQALGLDRVPVVDVSHMSEAEQRAYIIADNKLTEMGGWDEAVLREEVASLGAEGFGPDLMGFSGDEAFLSDPSSGGGGANQTVEGEDDVPETSEDQPVVSRLGDVWLLGNHRIVCGDCESEDVVRAVLGDDAPNLMVTDPPYGVNYNPQWRNEAGRSLDGTTQRITSGRVVEPLSARAVGRVQNDDRFSWEVAYRLFPGTIAYVWMSCIHLDATKAELAEVGFEVRNLIIWAKQNFVISRGHYHNQHETCWYAVRRGATACWRGGRTQSNLWEMVNLNAYGGRRSAEDERTDHSTQKPVDAYRRAINNHTEEGEFVYDPFCGSGTLLIACEATGRRGLAVELYPNYVDLAIRRWQSFSGGTAVLDCDGERLTFDEVAAQRAE